MFSVFTKEKIPFLQRVSREQAINYLNGSMVDDDVFDWIFSEFGFTSDIKVVWTPEQIQNILEKVGEEILVKTWSEVNHSVHSPSHGGTLPWEIAKNHLHEFRFSALIQALEQHKIDDEFIDALLNNYRPYEILIQLLLPEHIAIGLFEKILRDKKTNPNQIFESARYQCLVIDDYIDEIPRLDRTFYTYGCNLGILTLDHNRFKYLVDNPSEEAADEHTWEEFSKFTEAKYVDDKMLQNYPQYVDWAEMICDSETFSQRQRFYDYMAKWINDPKFKDLKFRSQNPVFVHQYDCDGTLEIEDYEYISNVNIQNWFDQMCFSEEVHDKHFNDFDKEYLLESREYSAAFLKKHQDEIDVNQLIYQNHTPWEAVSERVADIDHTKVSFIAVPQWFYDEHVVFFTLLGVELQPIVEGEEQEEDFYSLLNSGRVRLKPTKSKQRAFFKPGIGVGTAKTP